MNVIERAKAWVSAARASRTEYSGCEIITDLLSIVERLPVTADGVRVVDARASVYFWAVDDDGEDYVRGIEAHYVWEAMSRYYSTRAAAEAAREGE